MAVIPYDKVPGDKDSPLSVPGQTVQEYYCGDARCDCVIGHVVVSGVPMAVDLGTGRIDYSDGRAGADRGPVRQALQEALRHGGIERMRAHYDRTREYGLQHHHEYVDWTRLGRGQAVSWEMLDPSFRPRFWPLVKKAAPGEGDDQPYMQIALSDAYCIDPRCDCQQVVCTVIGAAPGEDAARQLGTVAYSFKAREPRVLEAQGIDADRLFALANAVLAGNPELTGEYAQRYRKMREAIGPVLQNQRREQAARKAAAPDVGRNDPCPCGSGKKFKKCHGA